METSTIDRRGAARTASFGIAGLVLMCLLYVMMAAAPVTKASAEAFCANVNLAPYGSYGDRCYAWEWEAHQRLALVGVTTHERAGCATSAAGSGYDLKEPWACFGKETSGYQYVNVTNEYRRGVIRNNNLTYSGLFTGFVTCCWS